MSVAVIWALNCVALRNVVGRSLLLNRTREPETKPAPLTMIARLGEPTIAAAGERLLMAGTGLLMVRSVALDVPPPGKGLKTVIENVPALVTSPAGICAVICVLLTNMVSRASPLKFTTELLLNPVPFTVSVKALPDAVTVVGEMVVKTGTGLLIVKVLGDDGPPPGPGFTTVTCRDPAI